jgi:peptide/nickel transport system permease protein
MGRYVALRLVLAMVVLFCLVTVVFFVSRVLGDPAVLMAPLNASPAFVEDLRRQLGFADPLPEQYGRFLLGVLRGDFGTSSWQHVPALPLVLSRVPATLQLTAVTMVIASVLGIGLGIVASRSPGSWVDNAVSVLSMVSLSTPSFWLALTLILVFAVELRAVPTSGYGNWQHFVLPVTTLVPLSAGRLAQITRSSMLDVLNQGYIRTAYAKGMRDRIVLLRHAFRNAALPTMTVGGTELAELLGGSVIVETIFGWPGVGFLTTQAIINRDPNVVLAAVLVIGAQVLVLNLVLDLLYAQLDPRIRFG